MATLGSVFITGAAGGLGRAFAAHYAGLGHPLVLADVREQELAEVVRDLQRYRVAVRTVVADLATRAGIEAAVRAVQECADLEILINNAAIGGDEAPFTLDLDRATAQLGVNALAPLHLSYAAIPGMRARRRGAIINVSSLAGLRPNTVVGINYSSTKAYLIFLSQTMQGFLAGSGITVQVLCPGLVDTGLNGPELKRQFPSFLWTPAAKVAAISHRALARGRVVVKPGLNTNLTLLFGKLRLVRYYYAVLRRWDRVLRMLNRLPPLEARAEQPKDGTRER